MIENEQQLEAARDWLRYWKSIVADGEQSWSGGEDARSELMRYASAISEYERRHPAQPAEAEAGGERPAATGESQAPAPMP